MRVERRRGKLDSLGPRSPRYQRSSSTGAKGAAAVSITGSGPATATGPRGRRVGPTSDVPGPFSPTARRFHTIRSIAPGA